MTLHHPFRRHAKVKNVSHMPLKDVHQILMVFLHSWTFLTWNDVGIRTDMVMRLLVNFLHVSRIGLRLDTPLSYFLNRLLLLFD